MMPVSSSWDTHSRKRSYHDVTILDSVEDESTMYRTRRPRRSTADDASSTSFDASSSRRLRKTRVASVVSADDDSARLTKTGRVSRALKGQPVHKCDFCGKFYTRAEHLRRHQLNHKSEPTWLCDVPGCEKSQPAKGFFREDLLQRHKEDHNTGAFSAPGDSQPMNHTANNQLHPSTVAQSDPFATSYSMLSPFTGLSTSTPDLSLSGADAGLHAPTPSSYSFPDAAPISQAQTFWRQPRSASFNASRSLSPEPTSLSLSPFAVPWSELEPPSIFDMSSAESDYTTATSVSSPSLNGTSLLDSAHPELCLIDQDLQESAMIENEVAGLSALADDSIGHAAFWLLEERYMPLFWSHFASSFPIVHRGTFLATTHVPILLKALMVTAGACFAQGSDARLVVRSLGQVCHQILKAREPLTATSSLTHLQMTFLAEAVGLYHSAKPTHGLTPEFETMSALLQFDPAMDPSHVQDLFMFTTTTDTLASVQQMWIEQESKRRLHMACFVLESQQAALFERQSSAMHGDMALPCSAALWETHDLLQWQVLFGQEGNSTARLYDVINTPGEARYDALTAAAVTSFTGGHKFTLSPPANMLQAITAESRSEFNYHAMHLASHTPIRDVLTIAGDPFVLGEQSMVQPEQAKQDVELWTRTESVSKAMFHAIHILRTAYSRGRVGVLHEDWALYMASLVCYTTGMWSQKGAWPGAQSQPPSATGLEWQMKAFLARFDAGLATPGEELHISDFEGTRACLGWTRSRLGAGGAVENAATTLAGLACVG